MENILIHELFRILPAVPVPAAEEYEKAKAMVEGIITFAKNQNLEGFVVDYAKRQMVYVSDGLARFCGKADGAECRWDMKDWAGHIPMEDRKTLVEAYRHGLEWFRNLPPEERPHTTLTYETHLCNEKKKRLFHHKLSPILLTPCGHIWMAVCSMKFSAFRTAGHITVINQRQGICYTYDPHARQWKEKRLAGLTP